MPQDGSNQVLHFRELARIGVPAMGMGQEWNMVLDWQARQHAAFSGRPAYRVDAFNTNHQSFSDICEGFQVMGDRGLLTPEDVTFLVNLFCGSVTSPGVVHPLVSKYQAAFLKTHLAGEAGYQHILQVVVRMNQICMAGKDLRLNQGSKESLQALPPCQRRRAAK